MKSFNIYLCGVGGQGIGLLSEILLRGADHAGLQAKAVDTHGLAQRGGVVESAIVFGNARSSIISDGEADVLVGFEPLETLRAINKCHNTGLSCPSTDFFDW